MIFPIIKSHLTGSPLEIFLRSGMRGMLASVFLLVTVSSCLFSFMTWVLVEVISVVELTSNLTLGGLSIMFLEWFFNQVPGWLGWLGTIPLRFLGFALKYMDPELLCDSPESEVLEPGQENLQGRRMLLCLQISSSGIKVNESVNWITNIYQLLPIYQKKGIEWSIRQIQSQLWGGTNLVWKTKMK